MTHRSRLLRNLALGLLIYGVLAVSYFAALRLLNEPLTILFSRNLVAYALITLGLVVAQGVLLDVVTSFLLAWLKIWRAG